jgi:hypothetical protein
MTSAAGVFMSLQHWELGMTGRRCCSGWLAVYLPQYSVVVTPQEGERGDVATEVQFNSVTFSIFC